MLSALFAAFNGALVTAYHRNFVPFSSCLYAARCIAAAQDIGIGYKAVFNCRQLFVLKVRFADFPAAKIPLFASLARLKILT